MALPPPENPVVNARNRGFQDRACKQWPRSDSVKENIQATLDHFLSDSGASELAPANTDKPIVSTPGPAGP
jgi:hypothetical protein